MSRALLHIASIAVALSLSGCGGQTPLSGFPNPPSQDQSQNDNGQSQLPPSEPGVQLRRLQAGDIYNYSVTGGLTVNGVSIQITGTFSRIITAENFNGQSVFKITDRLVYRPINGVETSEITEAYVVQDASGNIIPVGKRENRFLLSGVATRPSVPAAFGIGTSIASVIRFNNLPTYDEVSGEDSTALSIIARENVVTPVGHFGTWRTESSLTARVNYDAVVDRLQLGEFVTEGELLSTDEDVSSTEWWVPRMGTYARRQLVSTRSADIVVSWDPTERRLTTRTEIRTLSITLTLTGSSVQ
jgi:hypothetical protein